MKHFRSLLSLGAIEDDEFMEPFELHRIRSQQLSKSTRLSQRKRQSKQILESNTGRLSWTVIDGKKVRVIQPPLQHSYSTKLTRRQFFYPTDKTNETNTFKHKNKKEEEKSFDQTLELETFEETQFNFELNLELEQEISQHTIDLQLPTDSFYIEYIPSPSPMAITNSINEYNSHMNQIKHINHINHINHIKPRLNTTLPPPMYNYYYYNNSNNNHINNNHINNNNKSPLPRPLLPHSSVTITSRQQTTTTTHTYPTTHTTHHTTHTHTQTHTTTHPLYNMTTAISNRSQNQNQNQIQIQIQNQNQSGNAFHLNPENSITSIKSESIPARMSMNSWPSQQSLLNPRCSSKSTQIRTSRTNTSILSPILSSPIYNNDYKALDSPHLNKIYDTVLELTDDDEDDDEELEQQQQQQQEDDPYRPRLATIVSQASSVNIINNNNNNINYDNDNDIIYSDDDDDDTSRTITTNMTSASARTSISVYNNYSPNTSDKKDEDEEDQDVNIPFEYIPDNNDDYDDHNFPSDDENDEEEYEYINNYFEQDFLIDNTFPSYDFEFMANIGRGAYGVVDKAFHLKSCEIVAIKRSRSPKQKMMNSFKKEILICNEFSECEYIINMLEYGIDRKKNEICIALQYMNMGSLTTKLNYTLTEIKQICVSVLIALKELHNKLYVHNDIKPDNILFNNNMEIKLTDFGCCNKMRNENTPLTSNNGSINFQSYEKKFLSPIRYTTKSDLYSFGITICEILNGTHRFEKEEQSQQHRAPYKIPQETILNKYAHINRKRQNILIDFLNKCLHKNYRLRWSAKQLLTHPFLSMTDSDTSITNINLNIQKMDDLEFMIDTLISYYLHYNQSRRCSKSKKMDINNNNNNNNKMDFFKHLSKTPIDDQYTDAQRIENIAKYTGYQIDIVQDFIYQSVNDVKNKYLKR